MKSNLKLQAQLLNIPGVFVKECQQIDEIGIVLYVEAEHKYSTCPRCGQKSRKLHQNHHSLVKDLPVSGQSTYLRVNRRQFKCKQCGKPFSEELDYVDKHKTYTKRLSHEIVAQILDSNIRSVAERHDLSESEVQAMLKDAGKRLLIENPVDLKRLGIDEISLVKGQGNYCAILVDLDKRKPIGMIESRTQKELRKVFEGWGSVVLEQIEEVSIDLWKAYRSLAEELMPNATIVADRFHVMKIVNKELDKQRKLENREAKKLEKKFERERILEGLTKSKYALLKNEKELNKKQREKLEEVKKVSPTLGIMHALKEDFREIYEDAKDWHEGMFRMAKWLEKSGKYFPDSKKTIMRWFDNIIGYFDRGTSNGVVEGINNKLKLIKRAAYGFRNFENFRTRSMLCWYFNS